MWTWLYRVLKGGCSKGWGNWGTLWIPREDWGTLGNIRGITTLTIQIAGVILAARNDGYFPPFFIGFLGDTIDIPQKSLMGRPSLFFFPSEKRVEENVFMVTWWAREKLTFFFPNRCHHKMTLVFQPQSGHIPKNITVRGRTEEQNSLVETKIEPAGYKQAIYL